MTEEKKGRSIGIDLHPDQFNTAEIDMRTGEVHEKRYAVRGGIEDFQSRLRKDDIVVIEATTNTFALARKIQRQVKRVIIVHPGENRDISQSSKKTDRIDAMKLAKAGIDITMCGRSIKLVNMPDENVSKLRSLFTTYEQISKKVTMTRNRIHSLLTSELRPFVKADIMLEEVRKEIEAGEGLASETKMQIEMLYAEVDMYYEHIQRLKDEIEGFAQYWPEEIGIMISMDGVSLLVALALKADYSDIKNFKNGKHMAALLRTAPTVESSNHKTRYGSVSKRSRHLALRFILQIEHHFYTRNEGVREWRETHIKYKNRGKVRIAIARKIIMCIYAMLTKKELYRYMNPVNYARKKKKLEEILNKKAA